MKKTKGLVTVALALLVFTAVQAVSGREAKAAQDNMIKAQWENRDSKWFFYNGEGQMVKNSWVFDNGKWYYVTEDGSMITGWVKWKEKWYFLNPGSGDMAVNTITPDGWQVDADGVWVEQSQKQNQPTLSVSIPDSAGMRSGGVIPFVVTIKNNSDKTIGYVQGSGSFTTPQALKLTCDGLQPVIPKDYLGPATMDYVMKHLKPGEEISITRYIRMIKPNENFDNYTYEMWNRDQKYTGDVTISTLKGAYSDVVPAPSGMYNGEVAFEYCLVDDATGAFQGDVTATAKLGFQLKLEK